LIDIFYPNHGTISTVAGSIRGFKDGSTNDSLFNLPCCITVSNDGTLYVADFYNHRIRKISTNGILSTVTGSTLGFKDGSTNDALFHLPYCVTISHDGTLYVADTCNHKIRKISTNGIVSTVAGSTQGFKDGNTNDSLFNYPHGIAVSHDGTLYVADYGNHRIRKISAMELYPLLQDQHKDLKMEIQVLHYSIAHMLLQYHMVTYMLLIRVITELEKYQQMELYTLLQDQQKDVKMEIQMIHYSTNQVVLQSRMMVHYMLLILIIT